MPYQIMQISSREDSLRTKRDRDETMLLNILADSGQVDLDRDTDLVQNFLVPDTRQLEQVRSLDRSDYDRSYSRCTACDRMQLDADSPGRQYHLFPSMHDFMDVVRPLDDKLDAGSLQRRALAFSDDFSHCSVDSK